MHSKIVSVIALAAVAVGLLIGSFTPRAGAAAITQAPNDRKDSVVAVTSDRNDVSPPLRDLPIIWPSTAKSPQGVASANATIFDRHGESVDPMIQGRVHQILPSILSDPIRNFSGIPFTGAGGAPDPSGAAGATQYVQVVSSAYQVFDKSTGASVLGPNSLASLWVGFVGVCQTDSGGDPILLYDQLANRWIIAQPAASGTHECIAVSTTSDATGTYYRYDFNFGSGISSNPRLSVWPDAYYMSRNVFNSSGTAYLGPQAIAFNRAAMLAGTAATFITLGITGGPNEESFLPAHLDGLTSPPAGTPNTFVEWPGGNNATNYKLFHFHVDFAAPANSTFTQFGPLVAAAPFTQICPGTRACVPQLGTTNRLDAIGNQLMFRLVYRNFGTHESVVGNYTVSAGGVAGIRWFELRNVTTGPVTIFQESTYQPDSIWRWLGSAAMDGNGNLAVGFSASSSSFNPQIRYAGRNVGDPSNTLTSEKLLYAGTGSQTGSGWGTFSCLTIDPMDDTTFWYTNEYYESNSPVAWHTRIGSFRFSSAPVPLNAFSHKTHGGAGSFDLPLPFSGNVGIECRSGPTYQMIINFATPVTVDGATVTSGNGSVGGFSVSGSQITIDLTGVTDAQRIALTLSNVSDGTNTGNVNIPMGVLVGDTNADAVVNAGDALQTRNRSGQPTDTTNFRSDVNADGGVNSGDTVMVRARSGAFLP